MIKRAEEHTIVVRYEQGSPAYHADMTFEGGEVVAVCFGGNRLRVEEELLEALDTICKLDENKIYMDEPWQQALSMARAAIAKAKGADHTQR